jgi:hypothetical protein
MSSMYRSILALVLVPCLLLASCAPRMEPQPPQPPLPPPVPSAELQEALQGPLCPRLDGVQWPCSDTDGRLWQEWYAQRQAAGVLGVGPDYPSPTVGQVVAGVAGVVLVGAALVLSAGAASYHSHYHSHYPSRITTRCTYGRTSSSCTTRY